MSNPVRRQAGSRGVRVAPVLDEGPLVEEQVDPVADVELALLGELGVDVQGRGLDPVAFEGLAGDVQVLTCDIGRDVFDLALVEGAGDIGRDLPLGFDLHAGQFEYGRQ